MVSMTYILLCHPQKKLFVYQIIYAVQESHQQLQRSRFANLFGHDFANMMSLYKHDINHNHIEESMIDGFIVNALIAGICVSIIAGGLGVLLYGKKWLTLVIFIP